MMHSLNCCSDHSYGVLPPLWIPGTVNLQEETGGGQQWKHNSDLYCSSMILVKVLHALANISSHVIKQLLLIEEFLFVYLYLIMTNISKI